MAILACDHDIAYCEMTPVGINMVECVLSGDVQGQTVVKFDPSLIQSWIFVLTKLKCFNFEVAFQDLNKEVKAYNEEHGKKVPIKAWDKAFSKAMEYAKEERDEWVGREHVTYTLTCSNEVNEEDLVYVTCC